ncbi:uracil-DNA glycosylase [Psychroflexus sp. YR1-1]|uniref:Uracil-DNA glycosylase n=1 Tax=Psychroflexus aurantiacus TaxID=2709310 RepID=A0A6B3QY39_9FLAO|nr:uracil-DNA glycosylase [Psychroflexus aurantiacus]NEV93173.1 uracil-DNA glycosylase [Psychroflexus aurantiacus]
MEVQIEANWKNILKDEFEKPYFKALTEFVKSEYKHYTCYPKGSDIFNAFEFCPFEKTKVVILGQDPYHGPGQAHGLSFSVPKGIPMPPSLINIYKELKDDVDIEIPGHGNLEAWAQQGVLLLNATLTVRGNAAGSHQNKGWEIFTDEVIQKLSEEQKGVVFLLWGGFAKKKSKLIDASKHHILTSGHPSPLSANRGYWFGNQHFSKTNLLLDAQNKKPIVW